MKRLAVSRSWTQDNLSCQWSQSQSSIILWLVVVWLSWLSGRAVAAQASGVLGSTTGDCWPFLFTSKVSHPNRLFLTKTTVSCLWIKLRWQMPVGASGLCMLTTWVVSGFQPLHEYTYSVASMFTARRTWVVSGFALLHWLHVFITITHLKDHTSNIKINLNLISWWVTSRYSFTC